MIQKYYLFLIIMQVLATAFLQPAKAEGRTPEYIATATDRSVRLSKGQVEVSFMLDLGERIVYANHQRRVTPVLVSADGTRRSQLRSRFMPPMPLSNRHTRGRAAHFCVTIHFKYICTQKIYEKIAKAV